MRIVSKGFLSVCIPALALGLLFSYGCGGGGGSGSAGSPAGSPNQESRRVLDSVASEAEQYDAHEKISEASKNFPKAGSVVQSSNASGGVTTDRVSVEASYESGRVRYRVQSDSAGWSVDSNLDTVLQRFSGDWDAIELMKSLPNGDLYVDVYSEDRVKQNEDYIAGGLWIYVPDSTEKIEDLSVGVFGDGSDPFNQSDFAALTGTETYRGDATLMFSEDGDISFADAQVTLTIDFDRGTVKGRIHSFVDEYGEHVSGIEVLLEESDIGSSDSGFFRGKTDLAASGLEGEGKWGGQFFGNGSGTLPRIAGGTFGIATAGGEETALGVWGALNPNPTTTPPRNEPTTTPPETIDVPSHPRTTNTLSPGPFTPGQQYSWFLEWNRVPGATNYMVHVNSEVTPVPVRDIRYIRVAGGGCLVSPSADYTRTTSSTSHTYRFTAPNRPGERINFAGMVQACNSAGCSCPPR